MINFYPSGIKKETNQTIELTAPILTIKNENGQVTVTSEVMSPEQYLNDTTFDLQKLLNQSQPSDINKIPDQAMNSFDFQNLDKSHVNMSKDKDYAMHDASVSQ